MECFITVPLAPSHLASGLCLDKAGREGQVEGRKMGKIPRGMFLNCDLNKGEKHNPLD